MSPTFTKQVKFKAIEKQRYFDLILEDWEYFNFLFFPKKSHLTFLAVSLWIWKCKWQKLISRVVKNKYLSSIYVEMFLGIFLLLFLVCTFNIKHRVWTEIYFFSLNCELVLCKIVQLWWTETYLSEERRGVRVLHMLKKCWTVF